MGTWKNGHGVTIVSLVRERMADAMLMKWTKNKSVLRPKNRK